MFKLLEENPKLLLSLVRKEELKRLKKARYLSPDDILTIDFHKNPSTIIIEAGNGLGKTHSVCEYVSIIQNLNIFERIYITNFSQSACQNIVNKLLNFDCKVIWYIGIEKHCENSKILSKIRKTIGLPSFACYVCPFWRQKYKHAYSKFISKLQDNDVKLVKPEVYYIPFRLCTQPIFRAYFVSINFEERNNILIDYTPIIVSPSQLLLTHSIITQFEKYSQRQRKERKILMVIDEADTIFYNSLIVNIPIIDFTKDDYKILQTFSPKSKKLDKLIKIYNDVVKFCDDIIKNRNVITQYHIDKFNSFKKDIENLLKSFNRKRKEILDYVIKNNIETNVFTMVNTLQTFIKISDPYFTLRSLESTNDGYILYDYNFTIRILFSNEYPFKWFWKIIISATFPTIEIVKSKFISHTTKKTITKAKKISRSYVNVYIAKYEIFRKEHGTLNRNKEIKFALKNLIDCIKIAVKSYHEYFGENVKGVCLWFGNKFQFEFFINTLKKLKVKVYKKHSYAYFHANIDEEDIIILASYVGSPFSRSVDLNQYNISIAVAPLLRPPRNNRYWDIVDFSKAITDTLQAVMRIVRSPNPSKPKLLIFDSTLLSAFYFSLMPSWFKELVEHSKLKLLKI